MTERLTRVADDDLSKIVSNRVWEAIQMAPGVNNMLTVPVALSCSREEDIVRAGVVSRTTGGYNPKMGRLESKV